MDCKNRPCPARHPRHTNSTSVSDRRIRPAFRPRSHRNHGSSAPDQQSRGFRATYGTSPKQYARLARIEKVVAARKSGLGWADVAYACGFTDQAHLIHDFGTMVGGTPAELFGAARRRNFRGADAVPSLADSYNPFIV